MGDIITVDTAGGRFAVSGLIIIVAILAALVFTIGAGRLARDAYSRYYARKILRLIVFVVAAIALAIVWRPFAGQIGVVLGLFAAGVAFAAQEVIGALAGWLNIMTGSIFRVGDRVEMAGVRGDVIDITPLRTKILEMGAPRPFGQSASDSWVGGRQYTGRIVAISNKSTFTQPVFNYSHAFEYIWEELIIPLEMSSDWRQAEQILLDEARDISRTEGARRAIEQISRSAPVKRAEIEPRVFVRVDQRWVELSARFVVPVREARSTKDALTRRVLDRLQAAGIELAMDSVQVDLANDGREWPQEPPGRDDGPSDEPK